MKPQFQTLCSQVLLCSFAGAILIGGVGAASVFAQSGGGATKVGSKEQGKRGNVAFAEGEGSEASNQTGIIDTDAQIKGVAIINDNVFIDGEKVPKNVNRFKGRNSGVVYSIKWGKDGNITVTQNQK